MLPVPQALLDRLGPSRERLATSLDPGWFGLTQAEFTRLEDWYIEQVGGLPSKEVA
jgi:hypothetical protein